MKKSIQIGFLFLSIIICGILLTQPKLVLAQQCGGATTQIITACSNNVSGGCTASTSPFSYTCIPDNGTCWGSVNNARCEKDLYGQCQIVSDYPGYVMIPCGAGNGEGSVYSIEGNVDGYTCNPRKINGWAVGFKDGVPKNNPRWINAIQWPLVNPSVTWTPHQLTDILRNDVNMYYGITGNHGFSLDFPAEWVDGQSRNVKVGASGQQDIPFGHELSNSPITITCLPCTNNLVSSCAASGASVDLSWNAITGASGYMVRLNRDPLSVWAGCPAAQTQGGDVYASGISGRLFLK